MFATIWTAFRKLAGTRFRNGNREGFTVTAFWHDLSIVTKGCHKGIYLMRFKGSHHNRFGTVPAFVWKF